jgi:hypothetical protein
MLYHKYSLQMVSIPNYPRHSEAYLYTISRIKSLNGQKEDNDFINLKNESECDGRLHGFIYLYGYDPDLKEKVPLFVQANILCHNKILFVFLYV